MKYDRDPDEWDFRVPFTTEEAKALATFLESNVELLDQAMFESMTLVAKRLRDAVTRQRFLEGE